MGFAVDAYDGCMNTDEVIQRVIDQVEKTTNVKAILGEPIKQNNLTVIPIASISLRGGGGGGLKPPKEPGGEQQGGMGLGVSAAVKPIGYIRILGENAEFIPIVDKTRVVVSGLIAAGIALLFLGKLIKSKHD